MTERKYDLDQRLIEFGVLIISLSEKLPKSFSGTHLGSQLVRSGTAPALIYGEAVSAESRSDFIHKMKIALKELRESHNSLKMISRLNWIDPEFTEPCIKECNELIAIFVKSISTAQLNKVVTKSR